MEALRAYEVEIGIFGSQPDAGDLTMVNLGLSPIIAIAGPGLYPYPGQHHDFCFGGLSAYISGAGSETQARVMQAARQAGVKLEAKIIAEGREAVRDLVAEGFGIGFVAESEIGNDIRLSRIRLEGSAHQCRRRWPILSARRDVLVIRSFMRTLAKLVLRGIGFGIAQ